jgi:hypothetical protein
MTCNIVGQIPHGTEEQPLNEKDILMRHTKGYLRQVFTVQKQPCFPCEAILTVTFNREVVCHVFILGRYENGVCMSYCYYACFFLLAVSFWNEFHSFTRKPKPG